MAESDVSLMQFATRMRDDAARFVYLYEKAQVAAPGMLVEKQPMADWMAQLIAFLEEEHGLANRRKRPKSVSDMVTTIRARR